MLLKLNWRVETNLAYAFCLVKLQFQIWREKFELEPWFEFYLQTWNSYPFLVRFRCLILDPSQPLSSTCTYSIMMYLIQFSMFPHHQSFLILLMFSLSLTLSLSVLRKPKPAKKISSHSFGGIHKLRRTLRGEEGVEEAWYCVTRRGRDPKFCDITFEK